jgi:hypothetical protein
MYEEFSPHKTWEIQIQCKKRKEWGNDRLGWLHYFGPITWIFMFPFNVVIGEDFGNLFYRFLHV